MSNTSDKPICFVIAPIGEPDTPTRQRSNKVLKHVFEKALTDKFKVIRSDKMDQPGMITSQVLRAVQESPLVVADLTEHNPNVFYELAVRHAVEKPIIHVIEPRLSSIPFDVGGFRTIQFDHTDLDSVETAIDQLRNQAEQAMSGNWGENPIALANMMRQTQRDSPELLLIKQAVEGISNMSLRLRSLETAIVSANATAEDILSGAVTPRALRGGLAPRGVSRLSDLLAAGSPGRLLRVDESIDKRGALQRAAQSKPKSEEDESKR